jgi:hypothetical protein
MFAHTRPRALARGGLRGNERLAAALDVALKGESGVEEVVANPLTGRVLVRYSPYHVQASVETLILRALALDPWSESFPAPSHPSLSCYRRDCSQQNWAAFIEAPASRRSFVPRRRIFLGGGSNSRSRIRCASVRIASALRPQPDTRSPAGCNGLIVSS